MIRLKNTILVLLLFSGTMVRGYSQASGEFLGKLKTFSVNHLSEKVYLHFNKPNYAAGDTIYFKAYVTLNQRHLLSGLSGVLHVDLIDIQNKIDKSIKLQLTDGLAWGDFSLPDTLPKGNYRVRAYTRLMRNDGDSSFFYKTIPVTAAMPVKIPESGISQKKTNNVKPAIVFFPEAGELVDGILSKIAFKAIDSNGLGIDVKGIVINSANSQICSFASAHLGMGYFYLNPVAGETYRARLTYADGSQDEVYLPKSQDKGIVFSVNNDSIPKASIKIEANSAYFGEHKNKNYSLVIYSAGLTKTITFPLDSQAVTFDILKRHLYTGVAAFTLLSPSGERLCERILFVQNYDQLKLGINADKISSAKKEKATIELHANDWTGKPAAGHFSVAVIDETKVGPLENNDSSILSYLLLTSDLKGYIEQPGYYFNDTGIEAGRALDVLMLTQGYRHFEWKSSQNNSSQPLAFLPEKGIEIAGIAEAGAGKPAGGAKVSLVPLSGGPMLKQTAGPDGKFSFDNLLFTDTAHFILNASNPNGKGEPKITYSAEPVMPPQPGTPPPDISQNESPAIQSLAGAAENQPQQFANNGASKNRLLKEVKISSRKIVPLKSDSRYGFPDQVLNASQILPGARLATRLMGLLNGIAFLWDDYTKRYNPVLSRPGSGRLMIVVDDVEMPLDFDISTINSDDVKEVEIFKNSAVGTPLYEAVLSIKTSYGSTAKKGNAPGNVLQVAAPGFYKARTFYSPKYNVSTLTDTATDPRSAIYWEPELATGKDGNASLNYFNAEGIGNYLIVIEGIDDNGNIGRLVYRYAVK